MYVLIRICSTYMNYKPLNIFHGQLCQSALFVLEFPHVSICGNAKKTQLQSKIKENPRNAEKGFSVHQRQAPGIFIACTWRSYHIELHSCGGGICSGPGPLDQVIFCVEESMMTKQRSSNFQASISRLKTKSC